MIERVVASAIIVLQSFLFVYELVARYDTNGRQIALSLTNVAAIALYFVVQRFIRRRYGITIHWITLVIIASSVWLDAIGNFQHFYVRFWWWDRLTHAIGGLAVTVGIYVVTIALWQAGRFRVSWRTVNLYAFSVAQVLGVLYEVSEWIGDVLFATGRVGGPFDTPRDIFFNMLGGVAVILVGSWWRIRQRVTHGDLDRP